MPLPDRFCIDIPEPVPTYSYSTTYEPTVTYQYPCESSVVYRYPYHSTVSYYNPYEIVVKNDDRYNSALSETAAIRHDLKQIRNDLKEIKRQRVSPTYYEIKEVPSVSVCPTCNSSSSQNQQKQNASVPMYYCEQCRNFVEKPNYSVVTKLRAKTPNTTYQASYRPPPPDSSAYGPVKRPVTLNELQSEAPPSTAPVQHPRPWIPSGYKNQYPHRRWNLNVPHSEP